MAVRDENVAVRRYDHGVRLIEGIGTIASDASFAERHQDFSIGTEFENLVTLAVSRLPVGHPDVAVAIHIKTMREHEQPFAEALHQVSGGIKLEDGRIELAGAGICSASIGHPDACAIKVDGDTARGSPSA